MTEKSTINGAGMDALEQALERFGSERTRWPAPVRRNLAGLLSESGEAKARVREAEALDRLLDLVPPPEIDTRSLADRIMAAALAETPAAAVAPQQQQPKARVAWASFGRRGPSAGEAQWPAAALLAASLVLGTVFGLTGRLEQTVAPLVAQASYETEIDSDQIAFDADSISMFEEDLL